MKVLAKSTFDSIIDDGRIPLGAFVMSTDPSVTSIYGAAGFDWVLIDREHGVMDNRDLRAHLLAAEASGVVPIVRVLENSPTLIQQSLDAGARGIMVPKIATAQEAARAVAASRYQPDGRGMCPVVPASGFTSNGWSHYRDTMNENVVVLPLIETYQGVENIEEICAVPGVDYLFFGLADMSQDLGLDMLTDRETLIDLWERVANAAHAHHVRVGAPFGYGFEALADFGSIDSDLSTLRSRADESLAAAREALNERN
jgi:2-keto-3-deoxy-L-rhamnonate aldolase RhmA